MKAALLVLTLASSTAASIPARAEQPPLLTLPPPPSDQPLPDLQQRGRSCAPLQQALNRLLAPIARSWSVSVVNSNGDLLGDVNGAMARIPASNQKLISTAFALDRLGPDFRLRTQLVQRADGTLELKGQGDPDLGIAGLQRFAMAAMGQGGARGASAGSVNLMVQEEPRQNWWPNDWHPSDRAYAYGAPITRLALTSNALGGAVSDPYRRLETLFKKEVKRRGGSIQVQQVQPIRDSQQPQQSDDQIVLHEETSAPMHALMSLANTESHNFTAEVLLRQAADQWDVRAASAAAHRWMQQQGISVEGLRVADGSGLSRNNRVSSQTIAALLMRMDQHPYASYYQASMAIAGQRGTLRNYFIGSPIQGKFWGKTGTIRGVRSISGILQTNDGPRYLSMISNGASRPNATIGQILRTVYSLSPCPSSI
ncbi:D-alanyl-D-alanine carboxypeptidase/D-alanyl-D-alanine-endopeptidase [Synechococcus sp. CC9311]|uniref:D-alanyl-D-alanine carboxypeptidase/D-alanyl-D-alanine endopeptidase n=1 Tax=Synechococcus sp. (strain CC9311) TaxID=64471 RepID=UPI0000DDAE41|nr:D-alanyl-D-alanine carboxypeptidase/D-alanyl-D-alanine-endopeptidase [Synechococcus sp. CC9311]ABI45347.1 D-alanyl-D-alanine carboxypeptidase [Synechococcus sp. CC9311]